MPGRAVVAAIVAIALAGVLGVSMPAHSYWHSTGSGAGAATTGVLAPPSDVVATADGTAVAVSWTAPQGLKPEGYIVERDDADGTHLACGTGPSALLLGTSCTEAGLAGGQHAFRVIAVFRSWTASSELTPPVTAVDSPLGAATAFSVVGSSVTSTGFTTISGDLAASTDASVVGFPDGVVAGEIHAGDSASAAARDAVAAAFQELFTRPADAGIAGDLIGRTIHPGVYVASAALALTGVLTFDAGGDPTAVFIIQVDAAVNTAAGSSMVLAGGARASNVFWVVNAAVGTGADSTFVGTIVAEGAITVGAGTLLIGRALSREAVTLASSVVRFTPALPPTIAIDGGEYRVTKDATPTIAGTTTAPIGRSVLVTIADQSLTASVQPDGRWSVLAGALQAGTYPVVAKVKDADGNGASATQSLLLEVNPPPVLLQSAVTFSMLSGTSIAATGATAVTGDIGVSPGTAISGMPPGSVGGSIHAGDDAASAALAALVAAIDDASSRAPHTTFAGDTVGRTFHAGVHRTATAFALTGNLTLDAEGDPDAVFILQIEAAMNTAAGSAVVLTNGARASNVFWVVDGAVGAGATATLAGTILAAGTVTLGAGTHLDGRVLTLAGIVIDSSTISGPTE